MNEITLHGIISDIQPSHTVDGIEYDKANIIVQNSNGKDSILSLIFKKFSNTHKENDEVWLTGNVRSYSHVVNGKNKVDLYVFTYFNEPEQIEISEEDSEIVSNSFEIDGRICSIKDIRILNNGKKNIQFVLANNIVKEKTKLSNYLPCIAWGRLAEYIGKFGVNTPVKIIGELRSREYKKYTSENEFELKVAHELLVTSIEVQDVG